MFKRKFIIIANSFLHLKTWIQLLCRQTDPKNASSTAKFVNRWRKFARSFYIFSRVLNNTFFLRRIKRFCGFIGLQRFLLVFIFILTRVRTFTVYALRSFMSNLHFICIAYFSNFERVFPFDINFWRRSNVYESRSCTRLLVIIAATLRQYFQGVFL